MLWKGRYLGGAVENGSSAKKHRTEHVFEVKSAHNLLLWFSPSRGSATHTSRPGIQTQFQLETTGCKSRSAQIYRRLLHPPVPPTTPTTKSYLAETPVTPKFPTPLCVNKSMAGDGVLSSQFTTVHPVSKEAPTKAISLPKFVLSKYDYNSHVSTTVCNCHRIACRGTEKCSFFF